MKRVIYLILFILFCNSISAQNFIRAFEPHIGLGKAAIDIHHNYCVGGGFLNGADFDFGPDTVSMNSNGSNDAYIAMYDMNGKYKWAKVFGGSGTDYVGQVVTDNLGNLYMIGGFMDTVDLNPDAGLDSRISAGGYDIFISKFDTSGNFIWTKTIGGPTLETAISIALDSFGHVYAAGVFHSTIDFDPGPNVFNLNAVDSGDIFILKLDTSGQFIWAKSIGGTSLDSCRTMKVDSSGNIVLCGLYKGTVDFDPNAGVFNLTSVGGYNGFINKLDSSGNLIWAKCYYGASNPVDLAIDSSDNVYSTGVFAGTVDFNPGTGLYNLTTFNNTVDIYISKLDSSGNFVWAKRIGGEGYDDVVALSFDPVGGKLGITGKFRDTVDFDPGTGVHNLISTISGIGYDVYIAKYTTQGIINYAINLGGIYDDHPYDIILDGDFIYSYAYYWSQADLDPGPGQHLVTMGNYLLKLGPCSNYIYTAYTIQCDSIALNGITYTVSGTYPRYYASSEGCDSTIFFTVNIKHSSDSSLSISACNSYNVGSHIHTSSGTYIDTIFNTQGCDSIVTLNLTIQNIDTSVTKTGNTLHANLSGATYQWINCAGYTIISGATNQNFTTSINSNFAVIVSQAGCTDTSYCYVLSTLGLNDEFDANSMLVSPNPATDFVQVSSSFMLKNASIKIMDMTGHIVQVQHHLNGKDIIVPISNLAKGIYVLEVEETGRTKQFKVVKNYGN